MALGPAGHPHAPQDDRQQDQQHHAAAHQPELLPAHGEDVVGVPGVQGVLPVGLGFHPLEPPHSGKLARSDGGQGLVLLPALALGVQVIALPVLHHHPEAHDAVVAPELVDPGQDEVPQKHHRPHHGNAHPDKPPLAHPGHPGHHHEDEQVHNHHAPVAGQHRQRPGEHPRENHVFHQGREPPQAAGPLLVDHPGQHHDEGQLGDLPRLEAGKVGDGEEHPALVAAGQPPEGLDQRDDKQPQQQEHPPPLLHQVLNVDEGDPDIGHDAHADKLGLLHGIIVEVGIVPGGGVDQHQPHQAGQNAQRQQQHVALFEEFPDGARRPHGVLPFPENRRQHLPAPQDGRH